MVGQARVQQAPLRQDRARQLPTAISQHERVRTKSVKSIFESNRKL